MSIKISRRFGLLVSVTLTGIGFASNAIAAAGSSDDQGAKLEEVVVTAQKRQELIQDVPIPVTAIAAQTLVDNGLLEMKDYYSLFPGVNYASTFDAGFHANGGAISVRGVSAAPGSPATVGVLVDDVPFGPTIDYPITGVPDIDPGDLDHIEVLRGPQGALYGTGAMGGVVKYVTKEPSTDGWSGRLEWGNSTVYNGAELGYEGRGSINAPVSDDIAVRASAFTRLDPGYIDNPFTTQDGINKTEAGGGRLAALWKPSEAFSLALSALVQNTKNFGSPEVDIGPGLGDLQQNRILGTGRQDQTIQVYSATVKAKIGILDITSITGWNRLATYEHVDDSYAVPSWTVLLAEYENRFTQELRFLVPIGNWADWVIGGIYDHEPDSGSEIINTESTAGTVTGIYASIYGTPINYSESAAFTNLTLHLTSRFDLQLGGRAPHIEETSGGYYVVGETVTEEPTLRSKNNPLTYLVTPSFKLAPDFMVYARLASGYRPGEPNSPLAVADCSCVPSASKPDYTKTYDLGLKGIFLDQKLSVDAAVFYIDWKDIQLNFLTPDRIWGYGANGSAAKNEGLELSAEARPLRGLTISGWIDWNNAVITEAAPPGSTAVLNPGDRLPFVSRFSGNLSVNEEFPIAAGWAALVGGNLSYVGDRTNSIGLSAAPPYIYPSYAKLDLRAAVKDQDWTVNLFFNNVTDKRGLIGGGPGFSNPAAFYYIQPRTVGLSLVRTF